jgi:hypothetical protein
LNVVLPGEGTVELRAVELVQFGSGEDPLKPAGQWWSGRQVGLWGGLAGSGLGVLGALLGWLGGSGRARRFVLGATRIAVAAGVAALALGFVALASAQPPDVYFPLFLLGGISTLVLGSAFFRFRKLYEERELRRMKSLDASR